MKQKTNDTYKTISKGRFSYFNSIVKNQTKKQYKTSKFVQKSTSLYEGKFYQFSFFYINVDFKNYSNIFLMQLFF